MLETSNTCTKQESFALLVLGDSMMPEFKDGNVIVIDPEMPPRNGSFVFAKHQEEYIFRQLEIKDDKYFLKPLNPNYPTLEIPDLKSVEGVIISGGGTRRRDRKSYV
jgi:DNA polymerase V